jgi:hypothetical protein
VSRVCIVGRAIGRALVPLLVRDGHQAKQTLAWRPDTPSWRSGFRRLYA